MLPPLKEKVERGTITDIKVNNKGNICEFERMEFVDSYLNDISNKMVIDMNSVKNVIDKSLSIDGSPSFFETLHEIATRNGCNFLTVPIYNGNNIEEIFKPQSLYNGTHNVNMTGSKYIVLFPGETSKALENESSEIENDSFDICNKYNENTGSDFDNLECGFTVNAFGVTYGMQNQNYFKSVNINMESSTPTDYSIANTLNLAKGGQNGDQMTSIFLNNSLYPIYANRSYNCTVEMLGNVAITPLMYFQLNNVPMFRGTYMITEVSHKIAPGEFNTIFTGVRIPKHNIKPIDTVIAVDDFVNRHCNGDLGDTPKGVAPTTEVNRGLKWDETLAENKIYSLLSYTEPTKEKMVNEIITGNIDDGIYNIIRFSSTPPDEGDHEGNFRKCQESLVKFLYKLGNKIKNTFLMNDTSVLVVSTFRGNDETKYTKSTDHNWGFAIDIQGTDRKNNVKDKLKTAKLYNFIINDDELFGMIDQIIWETHEAVEQSFSNTQTDWVNTIHISTSNKDEIEKLGNVLKDKYISLKNNKNISKLPRHHIMQGFVYKNGNTEIISPTHEFVAKARKKRS